MRSSLFLLRARIVRIAILIAVFVAASPATAQSDPRWGVLANMAERDFRHDDAVATFRWEVPNKRLVWTDWFALAHISYTFDLDPQSGDISAVRSGGDRFPMMVTTANGDLVLKSDGHRVVWLEVSTFRFWGGSRFSTELGGLSQRLSRVVDSGKVRVANPAFAKTMQASAAPAASVSIAQTQPQPGPIVTIPAGGGPRLALVIGNSDYSTWMGTLPNPANDADAMGRTLRGLGFEVQLVKNAGQKAMKRAIADFGERLAAAGKNATGLFFYAGHGLQVKGINYLVPIDGEIRTQADVDLEGVAADSILSQMEDAGSSTNIVILDACRNMPLIRGMRSASRGLAPMDAPSGSFIAYSTAPGSVAADGAGANSPFVTALIQNISRKGQPIEAIFRDVRREVLKTTEGEQTPWDSSSLIAPFYFAGE